MELLPEKRGQLQDVLLGELRRIRDEAIAAGVSPATIARIVEERHQALDSLDDGPKNSPVT